MEWAPEGLKEEWLPALANGKVIRCFANTEPDCGSDAGAIRTSAVRDGDSYIINGEKTSVSMGMQADFIFNGENESGCWSKRSDFVFCASRPSGDNPVAVSLTWV